MVAVTVILAAVIAAFVLDMGSGLQKSAQAGVAVDGDGSASVTVTLESLGNADKVEIRGVSDAAKSESVSETINQVGDQKTFNSHDGDYNVIATIDGEGATIVAEFSVSGAT